MLPSAVPACPKYFLIPENKHHIIEAGLAKRNASFLYHYTFICDIARQAQQIDNRIKASTHSEEDISALESFKRFLLQTNVDVYFTAFDNFITTLSTREHRETRQGRKK